CAVHCLDRANAQGGIRNLKIPSKRLGQTRLFKGVVCPMAGFDVVVDHKSPVVDGALPDFVIAFALANEIAAVLSQDSPNAGREVVCHQPTGANSVRSALTAKGTLSTLAGRRPFSVSNSGITILSFSIRASRVSAPVARPGTSSLDATHTWAS